MNRWSNKNAQNQPKSNSLAPLHLGSCLTLHQIGRQRQNGQRAQSNGLRVQRRWSIWNTSIRGICMVYISSVHISCDCFRSQPWLTVHTSSGEKRIHRLSSRHHEHQIWWPAPDLRRFVSFVQILVKDLGHHVGAGLGEMSFFSRKSGDLRTSNSPVSDLKKINRFLLPNLALSETQPRKNPGWFGDPLPTLKLLRVNPHNQPKFTARFRCGVSHFRLSFLFRFLPQHLWLANTKNPPWSDRTRIKARKTCWAEVTSRKKFRGAIATHRAHENLHIAGFEWRGKHRYILEPFELPKIGSPWLSGFPVRQSCWLTWLWVTH